MKKNAFEFEYGVISKGSQTMADKVIKLFEFEYGVISKGSQTTRIHA